MKETFYTALDLGTSKVCAIVARVGAEGELKVLGTGIAPSQGIQKGCVENLDDARAAVKAAMDDAHRYVGRGANSGAYLVVSGAHLSSVNTKDVWQTDGASGGISASEMHRFIRASFPQLAENRDILHIIPMGYQVDGLSGVRNPTGLHASQVRMEAHVVTAESSLLKNAAAAAETNRIPVHGLVAQSLAAAEAVLTADEREMGVILVDIGGGTTDVTLFSYGNPVCTTVLPVGGIQLTRDLAVAERIPYYVAEEVKLQWGNALPELAVDDEVVLPGSPGEEERIARRRTLCEPLSFRMQELLKLAILRLSQQAELTRLPEGGLVFTGAGAELSGLVELTEKMVGGPARIGWPENVAGLPSQLRKPGFSAAVGALLWGIKHQGERRNYRSSPESVSPADAITRGYKSLLDRVKRAKEKVAR